MSDQKPNTTPKFGEVGFSSNPGGGNKQGFGQKSYKPMAAPRPASRTTPSKRGG